MLNRIPIIGLLVLSLCSCGVADTRILPKETPTPISTEVSTTGSLSEQLGFSDEVIQELQEDHTDCLVSAQRETRVRTSRYTAYQIACADWVGDSHLLVYQSEVSGTDIVAHRLILRFGGVVSLNCFRERVENWQDVDEDGLPDLIFCGGNNYYFHTYVFRMTDGGELENLLDTCPLGIQAPGIRGFADVSDFDGDGNLEIAAVDTRWDYDTGDIGWYIPGVERVFRLRDCEYQDVSASYPEKYEHTINVFLRNYDYLEGTITQIGVFTAFEGLLACDVTGRRDECWPLFWEMTDLERHPLDTTIYSGPPPSPPPNASDLEFIEWVNEKRAILEQQYEAGLPFSPEAP
jgi:hypothetical protein